MAAIPVRRRLVGRALREYRHGLGYSLDDAAHLLECHRSKVSRIETGQRGITPRELRQLLGEYSVDSKVQETLLALARPLGGNGWWRSFMDVLPAALVDYAIMESAASKIMIYETQQVPVLLQTRAYAEAIAEASASTDDETRRRLVDATLARQQAMLGAPKPDISFILGEGALRQEVGTAAVMREQATALASGTAFQVVPFAAGVWLALQAGPMTILEYAGAPELDVAYLGNGVWADDAATARAAFIRLSDSALTPKASARFVVKRQCGQ
ncbi:MAG: Scr1 family TA system antitoxin-like transcriptional regulator [Streptosporangiaceae bacterium]|jgi:transcriptional regulator with XRE-family HTH domain